MTMGYYVNSKGEKINVSEYNTEHPDGKILLLDGTELTCYEKQDVTDDKIDEEEKMCLLKLFTDNAFYLLAHRERILSDSRMFLCRVPSKSGLMYSGYRGFQKPTLGIYLEWWRECPGAMITGKDGTRSLVYHLAGSPLSGANWCKSVNENGEIHEVKFNLFISHWRPFVGINTRYTSAKQRYQAYSLEEVLEILHTEDKEENNTSLSLAITIEFMRSSIAGLNMKIEELNRSKQDLNDSYEDLFYKVYGEDMRLIYAKYKEHEQRINSEIEHEKESRRALKARLRQEVITKKEYDLQLRQINGRIKDMQKQLLNSEFDCLEELNAITGTEPLNISQIEHYITKYSKNSNE